MPVLEDSVAVRAVPEPDRLPTLTEVVQLATDPWAAAAQAAVSTDLLVGPGAGEPDAQAAPAPMPALPPVPLLVDAIESPADSAMPGLARLTMLPPPPPLLDEDQLTRRVLASLESRLDGLFEERLREALAPALARVADGLIRDLRPELTQTLHDMVHDAVLRALQDIHLR